LYLGRYDPEPVVEEAIRVINARLKEHGIGYEYLNDEIVRVDSALIHEEVVRPALQLLLKPDYAGAEAEFLRAHEHYRHGRRSETLVECYKAFESMMKSICEKRNWGYDKSKAAAHLVDVCLQKGLIPAYQKNGLTGLRTILESAIPAPRNKTAGHGAGSKPMEIPEEIVAYVLHLTAATILMLGQAEERLP
jgi:hypothetical protein